MPGHMKVLYIFLLALISENLSVSRTVLWCYFIWYAIMVAFYFDPTPLKWITSLGISALIGVALVLNGVTSRSRDKTDRWQLSRCF